MWSALELLCAMASVCAIQSANNPALHLPSTQPPLTLCVLCLHVFMSLLDENISAPEKNIKIHKMGNNKKKKKETQKNFIEIV